MGSSILNIGSGAQLHVGGLWDAMLLAYASFLGGPSVRLDWARLELLRRSASHSGRLDGSFSKFYSFS